jgi:hypothetical protein
LGSGEGNPAGNCEVRPAGLGRGDVSPAGDGVPGPATPGATVGAAGWGTARTDRLDVWPWLVPTALASRAMAQASRKVHREMEMAFTA